MSKKEIEEITTKEQLHAVIEQSKEDDKKRSMVMENIAALASGKNPFPENPLKSLTIRLSFADYAKLSVLASRLSYSPSGLGKILLVDALSDGLKAYCSVHQDEDSVSNLYEDIHNKEVEFIEDFVP